MKPDSPHSKHKPSWNNYFLQIARDVSLRASCPRASCGVVITSPDHRILSTGYNGAPSGAPECMDGECLLVDSHCVTGDTIISKHQTKLYNSGHKTIAELAQMKMDGYKSLLVQTKIRAMRSDGLIVPDWIGDVWPVGEQQVYEVRTLLGRRVKTTDTHRFYTPQGWQHLSQLSVGSQVALNGQPLYQNQEWLYDQYVSQNKTQLEIGQNLGVTHGTIRNWLRKFDIPIRPFQFGGWNKGMIEEDSHTFKGRGVSRTVARGRSKRRINAFQCAICTWSNDIEIHHRDQDVYNNAPANLMPLCHPCHKVAHTPHAKIERVLFDSIVSIEPKGVELVYDLETRNHHNFIGNGFVLHNCTRAAHGEQNAIAFAAQHGVSLKGSTLYCCFTLHTTPHYRDTKKCALCNSCRLLVISSGVQEVKILLDDGKVEVLQEWSLEQLIHGR